MLRFSWPPASKDDRKSLFAIWTEMALLSTTHFILYYYWKLQVKNFSACRDNVLEKMTITVMTTVIGHCINDKKAMHVL